MSLFQLEEAAARPSLLTRALERVRGRRSSDAHELEERAEPEIAIAAAPSVAQEPVKATIAPPADLQPIPAAAPLLDPPKLPRVPPADLDRSKNFTLVYGASGMGKTTLARAMYRARVERGGSAVFVDPKGENGWLGPRVVRSLAEFDAYWRAELRARGAFACVFQPASFDDDMNELWMLLYKIGNLLLVLDEADTYAPVNKIDKNLSHVVGRGRFQQIDIVTTVRTPPELNHQFTGNADVVITFRQELPDYADVLARRFFNGYDDAIRRLPKFSYLRRGPDGKITRGAVRV